MTHCCGAADAAPQPSRHILSSFTPGHRDEGITFVLLNDELDSNK